MATSTAGSPNILIVAGEASSALYAQRLLELWQSENRSVKAFGVGSEEMQALGFEAIGRSEDMAVVGFQEVIAHYSEIKSIYDQILKRCDKERPSLALLLDYPGFNLRLAKELKKRGIPVVYYISPQVWAWKKGRIKDIKEFVEKMLVLFPFEKPFYEEHKVPVEFVGHPLLDELKDEYFSEYETKMQRARYGIDDGDIVLGLMPGSRQSELKHHLETQLKVAEKINSQEQRVKVALFVAPGLDIEKIRDQLPRLEYPLMLVQDDPMRMVRLADVILTASGTATLLVGLMERPMVIMYKMNPITAMLARLFVRSTKYFGMINLVLDEEVSPEFFQGEANVERLSKELMVFIESHQKREQTISKLKSVKNLLGDKGATRRVAKAVERYLE